MLICDGFESFKRPYCLRRLNSTLNSTKNNGGESRYAPKGEYRRYSGLVPDYTSTKTSYSVVAPRLKGIILYHEAYRKSRILRCIFNTFRILDENNLFQNKKYLILRTDFRILCVIFIAIFFFMCYNKSEHICAFSVREFYDWKKVSAWTSESNQKKSLSIKAALQNLLTLSLPESERSTL